MARFEHIKVLPFVVEKSVRMTDAGRPRLDIEGWASTEAQDCDDEVIEVGFFDASLPDFMKRPLMPWMHRIEDIQGKWTSIEAVPGKGYHVRGHLIDFGTPEDTKRFGLVEEGLVASLSVGFSGQYTEAYGHTDKGTGLWHWTQGGKLHEVSMVPLPANPECHAELAKGLGLTLAKRPEPSQASPSVAHGAATLAAVLPFSGDYGEEEVLPKEVREELRFLESMERLRGASIDVGNYARHIAKDGRELTQPNRILLAEAHAALAAILEPYPGEPSHTLAREPYLSRAGTPGGVGALSGLTLPRARTLARG